jgi:hypothetical protein
MKQSVLLNQIKKENIDSLSLIGMAKNVGKTETLNHLIYACRDENVVLGVTSAGLDGEGKDLITSGKKPMIWLPEGFIFATAETCLLKAGLRYEILENSGYHNALGEIYIARVQESGCVELAGPPMKSGLKALAEMMRGLGAEIVLIDGALDRAAAASSLITKGAILCTGSVVGKSPEQIAVRTGAKFEQLTLPPAPGEVVNESSSFSNHKITFLNDNFQGVSLCLETLVGNENKIFAFLKKERQVRYLIINGAVSQRFLELVIFNGDYFKDIDIVVKSGNALFVDDRTWNQYKKVHGKIFVCEPINVLGISVNPYAALGKSYAPKELIVQISARVKPIKNVPVVDVFSGYSL